MDPLYVGCLVFAAMVVLLVLKVPVGVALMVSSLGGLIYMLGFQPAIRQVGITFFNANILYVFTAVPLFILMGQFASFSGIAEELYEAAYKWIGHLPGGMAVATIVGGVGFGACSGNSLATVGTMCAIAIPQMKKYKYDTGLSAGCVACCGSIDALIPPSIGLVLYGVVTEQPIGKLLIGGVIPGLVLALLFALWVIVRALTSPKVAPRGPVFSWKERLISLKGVVGIVILFVIVMGGMYAGIFTPTEAAAWGCLGAFVITIIKKRMTWRAFYEAVLGTARTMGFVIVIYLGAKMVISALAVSGLPAFLVREVSALPVHPYVMAFGVFVFYLLLGSILDGLSILLLTVPTLFPILMAIGFDPIWYGIIVVIVIEMAEISPPVGVTIFVISGMVPDIPVGKVFRGALPFMVIDFALLVILTFFPGIVTWLPSMMLK